ncbi:MAG: hypothetical protein ABF805_04535 [Bifidobacterium sp.]|uniref:hypothetical protein n=1 Tax=Bifidobacterium sp. TaxID=41200 RepID=UPI0039ECF7C1
MKSGHTSNCRNLTNRVPQLAQYFSGILRTAYLYSEQIVLTVPEVFDGIFFLAFGPEIVRDILGLTRQNRPCIIISGTEPTLLGCLQQFAVTSVVDTLQTAHATTFSLTTKVYSALAIDIQDRQTSDQREKINTLLRHACDTENLNDASVTEAEAESDRIIDAIVTSLEIASGMGKSRQNLSFLKQRWREWVAAVAAGDIEYMSNHALAARRTTLDATSASLSFTDIFKDKAQEYRSVLLATLHLKSDNSTEDHIDVDGLADATQRKIFLSTLDVISQQPKRSNAFATIESSELPHNNPNPEHTTNTVCADDTNTTTMMALINQQTLRDWYEFVYRKTLAQLLNSDLVSVNLDPSSIESMMMTTRSKESLTISGDITEILSLMPPSQFTRLCYSCKTTVEEWRACNAHTPPSSRKIRTRNMSYAVKQLSEQRNFRNDARTLRISVITSIALGLISILTDKVISAYISNVGIIILIACIIQIAPSVVSGIQWFHSTNSQSSSVVYLE